VGFVKKVVRIPAQYQKERIIVATLIWGDRVGRQGKLRVGASAVIFDETREKVLVTRRSDNGRWCLPSGAVDPGETVEEACIREVLEETGLRVRVTRLIGVYSSPDMLVVYPDGNKWHLIAFSFEAEVVGGELRLSDETTEAGYYAIDGLGEIDLMEPYRERIADALLGQEKTIIK
jgi:ADP-ribose pyrophosphatase YjhB (NUDIX family)